MAKGLYVILIELNEAQDIFIGKKHRFDLQKGFYGYVGSALSGLEKRMERHLNTAKKHHWHIDYLLSQSVIRDIICAETADRKECALARILSQRFPAIRGFGSSDCKCPSHLFYCQDYKALEDFVCDTFKSLGLYPLVYAGIEASTL